jgi:hypothetical protein
VSKARFVRRDRPKILFLLVLLINLGGFVCPVKAQTEATEDAARSIQFTISAQPQKTFEDLVQQARILAQTLVNQGFTEFPNATQVAVQILAEHGGQEIPLLIVKVSRSNWQAQPNVDLWTRYFSIPARSLLGFVDPPMQRSLESDVHSSPLSRGRSYRRGRGHN